MTLLKLLDENQNPVLVDTRYIQLVKINQNGGLNLVFVDYSDGLHRHEIHPSCDLEPHLQNYYKVLDHEGFLNLFHTTAVVAVEPIINQETIKSKTAALVSGQFLAVYSTSTVQELLEMNRIEFEDTVKTTTTQENPEIIPIEVTQ